MNDNLREFTSLPDIRKGSQACARDGTGDGVGARKVECQGGPRARRAFIFKRFQRRRAFSLQVYRGYVVARYIFKWFFALRGLVLALGPFALACAVVRGFEASFFLYINIFCELPIARPRRPYVI